MNAKQFALDENSVVWRDLNDEVIVLELATSTYLTLNGSGRLLWMRLVGGTDLLGLVSVLQEEYEIPEAVAVADAQAFIDALTERSLLTYVNQVDIDSPS